MFVPSSMTIVPEITVCSTPLARNHSTCVSSRSPNNCSPACTRVKNNRPSFFHQSDRVRPVFGQELCIELQDLRALPVEKVPGTRHSDIFRIWNRQQHIDIGFVNERVVTTLDDSGASADCRQVYHIL